MLTAAVRVPVADGVKATMMVQVPPAGRDVPQLLVWAKSLLLGPVMLNDVIVRVALVVLISVDPCEALVIATVWLPKLRSGGSSVTDGKPAILATKASATPPLAGCNGFIVGKSVDPVDPVTYALPELSTAMP